MATHRRAWITGVTMADTVQKLERRIGTLKSGYPIGRPKIGQGAKRINILMEKAFLKTADTLARRKGMTRAGLIVESVKAYIAGAA